MSDSKICPFCCESIKSSAVVCRFCNIDLSTGKSLSAAPPPALASPQKEIKARSGISDGVNLGCGMFIVLPLIILGAILLFFRMNSVPFHQPSRCF